MKITIVFVFMTLPMLLLLTACGTVSTQKLDKGVFAISYDLAAVDALGPIPAMLDKKASQICSNGYEKVKEEKLNTGYGKYVWHIRCLDNKR